MLDAYLSETPLKKASMNEGVKRIPNNLVTKDLVGGTTHESSIDATVSAAEKFITVNRFITENGANVTFKAFTLITPQPFFKPLLNNNFSLETQAFENFVSGKDSTTRIKITFRNALDEVVKIINTSFGSVGLRPIPILETIVASKYEIFISMEELVDPNNRFTNPSFTLTKMSTFSEIESAVSFYT